MLKRLSRGPANLFSDPLGSASHILETMTELYRYYRLYLPVETLCVSCVFVPVTGTPPP